MKPYKKIQVFASEQDIVERYKRLVYECFPPDTTTREMVAQALYDALKPFYILHDSFHWLTHLPNVKGYTTRMRGSAALQDRRDLPGDGFWLDPYACYDPTHKLLMTIAAAIEYELGVHYYVAFNDHPPVHLQDMALFAPHEPIDLPDEDHTTGNPESADADPSNKPLSGD